MAFAYVVVQSGDLAFDPCFDLDANIIAQARILSTSRAAVNHAVCLALARAHSEANRCVAVFKLAPMSKNGVHATVETARNAV